MNIQPLNLKIPQPIFRYQGNTIYQPQHKDTNLSPLTKDTVSFGIGEKHLDKGAKSVTHDLAMRVVDEAQDDAQDLKYILKKILSPYVASAQNPDKPILSGDRGIHVRVKSADSLRDKLTSRSITTLYGAKNVGDIIGGRIVLRSASSKDVDSILKAIAKAHTQGALNIYEIEKWIPKAGKMYAQTRDLGYGTSKGLAELENATGLVSSVAPQESGYPAIHIGIKTKNGFKAEIQIMGVDVEDLKEVEDLCYKIRCGKPIPTIYKSMEKILQPAFEELETKKLEGHYMDYVNDSYLNAFNYPVQNFNTRKKAPFLPIPYFLPQVLDFTNIAREMEKCKYEASVIEQSTNKTNKTNKKAPKGK